ncbi:IDEAL domain-containing protein [Thermolongibacillus altinsuensis]|jgi:uncharacterized protein YpiB (UPF0302 family)|uniref:IDEAL domain-containing protein n=1 Tax=Thermolongibacillus altinsuensis TaxID=575256 RepID=A0A4R1QFH0_9BACL|nr:IDEAL domain-containing protein [Thermolongibacillus altinsuensis]TCL49206.1 IDEAL domain-containing protein [Thermolongibacillus altinsuensis]GMB08654.1 hypothetical protein B1no1_13640 [Thermolongibacillus altinsuensis]
MYEKYNEMTLISQPNEQKNPYEQAAQLVIEQALFRYEKEQLMKKIDKALISKDESLFLTLSTQYNELRSRYRHLEDVRS